MTLFSILIPAYKKAFLKQAIYSCINQTYKNWELIIINDASPENLYEIVESFKDDRIKYYENKKNCGALNVVENWNICLSKSSGDYIICMGDDDVLKYNCLEDYYQLIKRYPNVKLFHALTEIIDENGDVFNVQQSRPEWESVYSLIWHRWTSRGQQYIGDFLFETSHLKAIGGFIKLPLAWGSDDITAVIAAEKEGVVNTQNICFQYRVNRFSISNGGRLFEKLNAIKMQKLWFEDFINNRNPHTYQDKLYHKLIKNIYSLHFAKLIKDSLTEEFALSKWSLFKCLFFRNRFDLSLKLILKQWIIAQQTKG